MDRRRLLLLGPLGVAAAAGAGFWAVLDRMGRGTFDPHLVTSPLLNRPVPDFQLAGQPPGTGFGRSDIAALRRPVLVNFFASWCLPCVEEAPELTRLAAEGVPIWGVAYKDTAAATAAFLGQHGNPFARIARDPDGTAGIEWGVYGVPETYLVDAEGVIRRKFVGAITPEAAASEIRPMMRGAA